MSSDYYFKKWKQTLVQLEHLVDTDLEYQMNKAHDQKQCPASQRLVGVLGGYIAIYNDVVECQHQNLQVQKAEYIDELTRALVARILEMKTQLRKLDLCYYHFLGHGLTHYKLTTYDIEMTRIPKFEKAHVHDLIEDIRRRAREKKEELERLAEEELEKALEELVSDTGENWWDLDIQDTEPKKEDTNEVAEKISEETLRRREMAALIQAQERARQVTRWKIHRILKKEMWTKELEGTLPPLPRLELRERSASLIQRVCRAYFEIKRKKIRECKVDRLLGIKYCGKPSIPAQINAEKVESYRVEQRKKNEEKWKSDCEVIKQRYMKLYMDNITEDYRDEIRSWFKTWVDEAKFFYDIPKEKYGGTMLILKDEIITPSEWLEQYETYLEEKNSKKKKTAMELKWEKMEAKKEKLALKKERMKQKKQEEASLKKMMKNPKKHPGFHYPESKRTHDILEAIERYHKDWDDFDEMETLDVKEESVYVLDLDKMCMEVKFEIRQKVDEEMREELHILNKALREDYKRNDKKMPERMPVKYKMLPKKKDIVTKTVSEETAEKMEYLIMNDILKEYPKTKFKDFIGDHNFAGDDLRCNLQLAHQFAGETRNVWWEMCHNVLHSSNRILLIGPPGCGKTMLVHVLATINDAVLFELDVTKFENELLSPVTLQQTVNSVITCAKTAQPSVIYIKYVQRLFYKVQQEADSSLTLIKRNFIRKLLKKIHKKDKITIIGSCIEPWLTKSKQILKHFHAVLLLPDTTYSAVYRMLSDWLVNNPTIQSDFNIHSLAYVLQGYGYNFLQKALQDFMSADQIVKIAANGLSPVDVYNFVLQYEDETNVVYEKYQKWYYDYTNWGKKEKKNLEEQREFQALMLKWAEKEKKHKK